MPCPRWRADLQKIRDEKIVNAILEQFLQAAMIHGQIGTEGFGLAYFVIISFNLLFEETYISLSACHFSIWILGTGP